MARQSATTTCERVWRVVDPDYNPRIDTVYRRHRCGEYGIHDIHVCRYCGRRMKSSRDAHPSP